MREIAPSVSPVRALERGLDVLQAVETHPGAGLATLHAITGLPKATLLRLLKTLVRRNLVWQRLADGAYLPSRRATGGPSDVKSRLVEIASPVMEALCAQVNWPSVLAVRAGAEMEVIETNRPRSQARHYPLGPVGARVDMLSSASGRAYFAFCGASEREEILGLLRALGAAGEGPAHDRAFIARLVAQTQAQGYGQREPVYGGGTPPDGRRSIGVPVIVGGQVVAALNLTWMPRSTNLADVSSDHLEALKGAASAIARGLMAVSV
ncbi:MAG TPA: helix-turn-helix domain-containing protein [Stellaceae bacterium]|nr:helix-turn-helix domain-containing protein [Stellaceae bacterium]